MKPTRNLALEFGAGRVMGRLQELRATLSGRTMATGYLGRQAVADDYRAGTKAGAADHHSTLTAC